MDFLDRRTALQIGMTDAEIRRATAAGSLVRVVPGLLADAREWESLTATDQYAARVRAAAARLSVPAAVSHQSAAVLHGLPLLRPDYGRVRFTLDGHGGGHGGSRPLHRVRLDDEDVTRIDGMAVTTCARTALDVACSGTFAQAVCVIESALRAGSSEDDLRSALARVGRRHRISVARAALDYADPRTESIGESWSRALMRSWSDIPAPRLQHEFRNAAGYFVARTDFDWDGRLVGEFDGRAKYGGGATDAVIAERQRENKLHAMGIHVVRWTWDDLRRPAVLHRLLRDGLDRVGL